MSFKFKVCQQFLLKNVNYLSPLTTTLNNSRQIHNVLAIVNPTTTTTNRINTKHSIRLLTEENDLNRLLSSLKIDDNQKADTLIPKYNKDIDTEQAEEGYQLDRRSSYNKRRVDDGQGRLRKTLDKQNKEEEMSLSAILSQIKESFDKGTRLFINDIDKAINAIINGKEPYEANASFFLFDIMAQCDLATKDKQKRIEQLWTAIDKVNIEDKSSLYYGYIQTRINIRGADDTFLTNIGNEIKEINKNITDPKQAKINIDHLLFVGYCKNGSFDRAVDLLDQMRESGRELNLNICNGLIVCYLRQENETEAQSMLFEHMQKKKLVADESTYFGIMEHYLCNQFNVNKLQEYLDYMKSAKLNANPIYFQPKDIERLTKLFILNNRNASTPDNLLKVYKMLHIKDAKDESPNWSLDDILVPRTIINPWLSCYLSERRIDEACYLFDKYVDKNLKPIELSDPQYNSRTSEGNDDRLRLVQFLFPVVNIITDLDKHAQPGLSSEIYEQLMKSSNRVDCFEVMYSLLMKKLFKQEMEGQSFRILQLWWSRLKTVKPNAQILVLDGIILDHFRWAFVNNDNGAILRTMLNFYYNDIRLKNNRPTRLMFMLQHPTTPTEDKISQIMPIEQYNAKLKELFNSDLNKITDIIYKEFHINGPHSATSQQIDLGELIEGINQIYETKRFTFQQLKKNYFLFLFHSYLKQLEKGESNSKNLAQALVYLIKNYYTYKNQENVNSCFSGKQILNELKFSFSFCYSQLVKECLSDTDTDDVSLIHLLAKIQSLFLLGRWENVLCNYVQCIFEISVSVLSNAKAKDKFIELAKKHRLKIGMNSDHYNELKKHMSEKQFDSLMLKDITPTEYKRMVVQAQRSKNAQYIENTLTTIREQGYDDASLDNRLIEIYASETDHKNELKLKKLIEDTINAQTFFVGKNYVKCFDYFCKVAQDYKMCIGLKNFYISTSDSKSARCQQQSERMFTELVEVMLYKGASELEIEELFQEMNLWRNTPKLVSDSNLNERFIAIINKFNSTSNIKEVKLLLKMLFKFKLMNGETVKQIITELNESIEKKKKKQM